MWTVGRTRCTDLQHCMQVDPSELTEPDGTALSGIKAALAVRPALSCAPPCILAMTLMLGCMLQAPTWAWYRLCPHCFRRAVITILYSIVSLSKRSAKPDLSQQLKGDTGMGFCLWRAVHIIHMHPLQLGWHVPVQCLCAHRH